MKLNSRITITNAIAIISIFAVTVFLISFFVYKTWIKTDERSYYEFNIERQKKISGIGSKGDDARLEIAMSSYLNGQIEDALKILKPYLNKKPQNIKALLYTGLIYVDLNNYKDAVPLLSKVESMDANYERELLYYNLGLALFKTGDYQNAIKKLKIASQIDPGYAMANFYLGQAYFKVGKYTESKMSLNNALKLDPNLNEAVDMIHHIEKMGLDK